VFIVWVRGGLVCHWALPGAALTEALAAVHLAQRVRRLNQRVAALENRAQGQGLAH
jgi:hypothetical protein